MNRFLIIVFLVTASLAALAQQDPQFSQFMFNQSYWSPALTAADGYTSFTAFSRTQWLGYETSFDQQGGAPSTQFLNFSMPLTLLKLPVGIGGNVIYDKTGPQSSTHLQGSISYALEFPRGDLRFGLQPSVSNQVLDFEALDYLDPSDQRNTGQRESQITADLAVGAAFTTENYLISLGVSHLLRPSYNYGLEDINGSSQPSAVLFSLYADYQYDITYQLVLSPSVLVQTDLNGLSYNAAAVLTYSERIWGGLSYRNSESVVFLMGYSVLQNRSLKLGYSFDYVIDEREAKSATSHEFFLKFILPSISTGEKKIIRTPRFRF